MNSLHIRYICAFIGMLGIFAVSALAGDSGKELVLPGPGPFDRGTWEVEGGAGYFGSFSTGGARPTINYQLEDIRVGWMYDSPRHSGWLRGNNEFLLEVFGGPVTTGPGNFLAGGSPLWRYNFVQPDARWVP